jgi:hypothetical protein
MAGIIKLKHFGSFKASVSDTIREELDIFEPRAWLGLPVAAELRYFKITNENGAWDGNQGTI